ncbi:uncharacterized protein AB675_2778 [Cyphellophora attinorum]|uniref:F-box domain-containing protein n=1 Tax=Cyphellophora attinorum TaxID=1664694 RepID=A0A0N1HAR3_9EURO|nr:uncharacterized protein AB675_2778 [Phialophora attinorum]KPI45213.1 hypothetical protein AB675_2778 [Phialophora attinorum]
MAGDTKYFIAANGFIYFDVLKSCKVRWIVRRSFVALERLRWAAALDGGHEIVTARQLEVRFSPSTDERSDAQQSLEMDLLHECTEAMREILMQQHLHANAGGPSNPVSTACSVVTNGRKHDVQPQNDLKVSPAEESSKTTTFLTLPGEIHNQILDELKFPDLCRFRATSQQCRGLVPQLRMQDSIEQFEHDFRAAQEENDSTSAIRPEAYSKEDFERFRKCRICYGCTQMRPRIRFGIVVKLRCPPLNPSRNQPPRQQDRRDLDDPEYFDIPEYFDDPDYFEWPCRIAERSSRLGSGRQMLLCIDCTLKHPQYLSAHSPRKRWLRSTDRFPRKWKDYDMCLICTKCHQLKHYPRLSSQSPPCQELRLRLMDHRQLDQGMCHECWYHDHESWCDAQLKIEERAFEIQDQAKALSSDTQALQSDIEALQSKMQAMQWNLEAMQSESQFLQSELKDLRVYRYWMRDLGMHPADQGSEPPRSRSLLEVLPDWTEELRSVPVKEVQSQLVEKGLVIPAEFKSRGPRKGA